MFDGMVSEKKINFNYLIYFTIQLLLYIAIHKTSFLFTLFS